MDNGYQNQNGYGQGGGHYSQGQQNAYPGQDPAWQQSWTGQNAQQPGFGQNPGGQGGNWQQPNQDYAGGAYQQPGQNYSQGAYQQTGQVWPQGAYQQPVVVNELENKKDGLAVTSLVLGILGIIFCWCVAIPVIICLVGLGMGIASLIKTGQHSGVALGGVITSAVGLVLSVALLLLVLA